VPRRPTAKEYNDLAVFFYGREAYDLAIAQLRRALKLVGRPTPVLLVNLGAAYLGKRLYAEARAAFEQALALDPDYQKAQLLLARTLKASGSVEAALAAFERAWRLNPNSPEGHAAEEELRALRAATADPIVPPGDAGGAPGPLAPRKREVADERSQGRAAPPREQ